MKTKVIAATLSLLAVAGTALALWAILGNIEGEGTTKAGKASVTNVPIAVTVNEGVAPGTIAPVALTIENATSFAFDVKKLTFAVTDGSEGTCPASLFTVKSASSNPRWEALRTTGTTETVHVPAEANTNLGSAGTDYALMIASNAPTACEGVAIKVHVVAEHA